MAKRIGYDFFDCDLAIQQREKRLLEQIIREDGMDGFLDIEASVNASIPENTDCTIFAPGGSVVLRKQGIDHLKNLSTIVYLKISYEAMSQRIGDPVTRGVAMADGMTLETMYKQRARLYEEYADLVIDENGMSASEVARAVKNALECKKTI